MRVLSLFSGGGLGDYGLTKAGMEIVGQVEWDKYCQKILKLRWPEVPKWEDVRDVTGEQVREKCGAVDLIAGGFPCQPFSVAGKKKGKDDERNMWPEMYRIISEVKPAWVLAENVRGIVKPYLDTVLSDLEGLGYSCLPLLIPASAVGAPHRRERLWIVGYSLREGLERHGNTRENEKAIPKTPVSIFSSYGEGGLWTGEHWSVEPAVGRVAHGIASRVDRLKLLGNGQVVQVVEWIGKQIMNADLPKGEL